MHGHGGAERGLIHWTIDYLVIPGNPAHDAVWETLAQVLNRPYVNARGRELLIEATAIDEGGHHTDDVRWFATQGKAKRTMAVKGMNRASRTIMPGGPKPTDINRLGKKLTGGARTWDVGTDVAKSYLVKNLVADGELQAEAQRVRFHAELEDTFYAGLLAESFDPSRNRWIKKAGRRNEPLDTWGYAWFAAHHPQVAVARKTRKEWAALAAILEPALQEDGTVPAVVAKPAAEKPGFRVKPGMTKPSGGRGGDGGFY
jgi:phage terminase large subunit GpA-like protein